MAKPITDGETREVQGSGSKPYILKNIGGVMSCTCPAWRNQSIKLDLRTCKHLKKENGTQFEEARIAGQAAPTQIVEEPTSPVVLLPKERRVNKYGGFVPYTEQEKAVITAAKENELGRKIRQDEKVDLFGPPLLLAHQLEDDFDPTGWWESEKLDGVRAYWNGEVFISRQGNVYDAPKWFVAGLPKMPLDGELWIGRGQFQKTISIVRRQNGGDLWEGVKYLVFDAPSKLVFEARMQILESQQLGEYASVHDQIRCGSKEQMKLHLVQMSSVGAEGLMYRKPGSLYEPKRSHTLIKVKAFLDEEAMVTGYEKGKGRHKGRTGALIVRTLAGKEFSLGTGLSDKERENPPKIGSIITYKYTGLTDDGLPKCASFVTVRDYE